MVGKAKAPLSDPGPGPGRAAKRPRLGEAPAPASAPAAMAFRAEGRKKRKVRKAAASDPAPAAAAVRRPRKKKAAASAPTGNKRRAAAEPPRGEKRARAAPPAMEFRAEGPVARKVRKRAASDPQRPRAAPPAAAPASSRKRRSAPAEAPPKAPRYAPMDTDALVARIRALEGRRQVKRETGARIADGRRVQGITAKRYAQGMRFLANQVGCGDARDVGACFRDSRATVVRKLQSRYKKINTVKSKLNMVVAPAKYVPGYRAALGEAALDAYTERLRALKLRSDAGEV